MSLQRFFFGPGDRTAFTVGVPVLVYLEFWALWFYFKEDSLEMALYVSAIAVWFSYQAVKIRRDDIAFETMLQERDDE